MSSSGPSHRKIKRVEKESNNGGAGSDDDDQQMNEATRQALSDIDECQNEFNELNEKESKEIFQVKKKYNKLRKPYYDKRAAVIEKIPNFWVNAIVNHPQISMLVDEEEEDCLHFLKKLEVEEFDNVENGFRVKFIFDENPFFENAELIKEFQLGPNSELINELHTEPKSTSTVIKWKENMDLSKKQPQIIDARRKRGLEQKTFFSWFSENKDPTAEDDLAMVIKDNLWPNPLQNYLTPDMEDGDDETSEEGEEEEEEEDEDDGVEEQEDDDDDVEGEEEEEDDDDSVEEEEEEEDDDDSVEEEEEEEDDDDNQQGGMNEATQKAICIIDAGQNEFTELNEKESKEIFQIKTKYNKLRKPYYDKRAAVIEKIPHFWVNAIVHHPKISMLVDEEEDDCLHFLKKLEVEEFENVENGFRVKFIFDENPFFENAELIKEFQLGPNSELINELHTEPQSTSTTIKWKENMDLSKKQPQIIDARRKRGLEQKTFFSWFSDNKDLAADDIAEVIKDDLWPNPLQYYLTPDMEDGDDEALEEGEKGEEGVEEKEEDDDDGVGNGEREEKEEDDDDGVGNGEREEKEEDDDQ